MLHSILFLTLLMFTFAYETTDISSLSSSPAENYLSKEGPYEAPSRSSPGSSRVQEAKLFCTKNKLDTTTAFFADLSIHSGKNRFFIINLSTGKVLYHGLVCHGMGRGSTVEKPVFSNEKGSNCSSLGKYKTGIRAYSNWGINVHYKLHGLESGNSNAYVRTVVLHSYDPVSETEIFPQHLPMGWSQGCPVVSNRMMEEVDKLLKGRKVSMLLWMYTSGTD